MVVETKLLHLFPTASEEEEEGVAFGVGEQRNPYPPKPGSSTIKYIHYFVRALEFSLEYLNIKLIYVTFKENLNFLLRKLRILVCFINFVRSFLLFFTNMHRYVVEECTKKVLRFTLHNILILCVRLFISVYWEVKINKTAHLNI